MQIRVIEAAAPAVSLARVTEPDKAPLRVGVVQHTWSADREALILHFRNEQLQRGAKDRCKIAVRDPMTE